MNSDELTPDTVSAAEIAPQEAATSTSRRSRSRRTRSMAAETEGGPEMAADVTTDTGVPTAAQAAQATSRRRSRRRTTGAQQDDQDETPRLETVTGGELNATAEAPAEREPLPEIVEPLNAQGALVSEGTGGDVVAAEAPLTGGGRNRSRGRGRRDAAGLVEVDLPLEAPAPGPSPEPVEPDIMLDSGALDAGVAAEEEGATTGASTGRRRRRRGRGGRGATVDSADAIGAIDAEASATDGAEEDEDVALELTEPDLVAAGTTSETPHTAEAPALRRRFDHYNWRERLTRGAGRSQPAASSAPEPALASAVPTTRGEPSGATPFERPDRGRRFGERSSYRERDNVGSAGIAAPPMRTPPARPLEPRGADVLRFSPAASASPVVTPAEVAAPSGLSGAGPILTPATADLVPAPSTTGGGTVDARVIERLERALQSQSAMLQQQSQALQALTATLASLQGAIDRMSTTGIAAGMPRAGLFVDAPNVIYAAENARVNIDYGRMLDFLGRGREIVHAIVYAPVTEDTGYRFENQRFVAPFLYKGYKMVTKPLKRFPDGTAKGNFDIELAIDIVTMSQRLDVVILLSGDSDFSRLIELIQSRGVRVEVVSFASNVSWELVQMADVFIDIGQYIDEFRAL